MDMHRQVSSLPNNLGGTLLIAIGLISVPVIVGIPLLLYGLSKLKTRDGHRTYAALWPWPQPRV